ncbi:MAG: lipid-binding protein [Flavobacteriales bacterium]|nr:lipid-binding protein [Flavobacteriales bacterium]|tara:strand:- start:7089 stop:7685 length:597 start_codon:yes stop_codon:yes gene_type:complete
MRKLFSTATALMISAVVLAGGPKGETYKVNKESSNVEWVGKKVTGEHFGVVKIKEGTVEMEGEQILSGTLVMDMNTIKVQDIEDPETNGKLKGHLMSDDFFGVKNHPTATLKINKVEKIKGNKHTIYADLTIKGKTEAVEIPATIIVKDDKVVTVGEIEIDRTKFDIRYGSGQFFDNLGDNMIYDDFTVKFKVGAVKG